MGSMNPRTERQNFPDALVEVLDDLGGPALRCGEELSRDEGA